MIDKSPAGGDGARLPQSYWSASSRHASAFPALLGDTECDIAIIGAGFTGLAAAHFAASSGRSCVVLEAHQVGWGASGRNGGMAVPRYKLTYPELERKYGIDSAVLMYRLAHEAVDTVERIVADCNLACGFRRFGHVTPVLRAPDELRFEADVEWLARNMADKTASMLDARQVGKRLGTAFYRSGYFEPRGAGIHPLEYCQALSQSLSRRGVALYENTPVDSWSNDGSAVVLRSARGRIRARYLLIATNGYTDLTSVGARLKRRIVPIASALIATAPLGADIRSRLLPEGNLATDAKRLTNYYRVMPDGRFVFGGRGGASSRASERVYQRLVSDMGNIFPSIRGVGIDYRWFGLVAVTLDSLPHLGQLATNVSYALGYNGRGVALAALLGKRLAQMADGGPLDLGPITNSAFRPIPFHVLRVPAKNVAISLMRLRDAIGI